ncbi:hypothetical protein BGZ67_008573 [Mortierella alpina]|nr:hypothetical protein BGZ67_008573 [Mortierella alpina]
MSDLLRLPLELLSCVVQYLVQADDLHDHLSLSRTCKDLYATLWVDSADMWKIVWKELYDDSPVVSDQTHNGMLCSEVYKETIKSRMKTLQLTRGIATKLGHTTHPSEQGDDPDLYHAEHKTQRRRKTPKQAYALSPNAYLNTMMALVDLAHGLGDKNAHWVQSATTSEFWAHAIHLWFSKATVGGGPLRASHMYHAPATLCKLFDVLAKVATADPSLLRGLYCNSYGSFSHVRRLLINTPNDRFSRRLILEAQSRSWFPWSVCHVFFLTLFCGPGVALHPTSPVPWPPLVPVIPSWFNQGIQPTSIKPIPLIPPYRSRVERLQQQVHQGQSPRTKSYPMSGRWTGYYAYQTFLPYVNNAVPMDDEDDVVSDYGADNDDSATYESDDLQSDEERPLRTGITRGQEFAMRGLKVDRRMIVDLVDGTTDWLDPFERLAGRATGSQNRNTTADSEPLYLSSDIDAMVLSATDESFLSNVALRKNLADEDDLNHRRNWGHQRVFSGRGHDAVGDFGIRGIVSEKTGLVRMIKTYFSASQLEFVRGRQFFEFGNQPHQLASHPRTGLLRWCYRGHVDPEGEGPGVVGLWYDEEVSGPFWLYRVSS